jgi:hypothetical protein
LIVQSRESGASLVGALNRAAADVGLSMAGVRTVDERSPTS